MKYYTYIISLILVIVIVLSLKYSFSSKEAFRIPVLNNLATATPSPTISPPEFASDNIDATFHADLDKPEHREKNSIWQKNKQGELEKVYYADISNTSIYYDPADYPYGPSSYVPNYEEATKLSYYSHPQSP